jgi:hypothetical protein
MPPRINLGKHYNSTMAACMGRYKDWQEKPQESNPFGYRTVMGFNLPSWQRGLVWTERQKIAFIESAWRGIGIGAYTYNVAEIGSAYDYLLIDGQQRMNAIECYLADEFPVFGYRWSEVTDVDRRMWSMTTIFGSYVTDTKDEDYLRNYYDLMNFGGTAHRESERASR